MAPAITSSAPPALRECTEGSEEQIAVWSDGLIKRLANSWRGTLLTMQSNSQDLTAPDIASALRPDMASALWPLLDGQDSNIVSSTLTKTEKILSSFLQSKFIVTNIDRDGLVNLTILAVQSCSDLTQLRDLEMRIGFGASSTETPNARVPAYILAAKAILTSLRDQVTASDGPRVVLYSASRFVEAVNGGDREKIARASQRNFDLIRSYLARFAPELASSFTFDEDRTVKRGEPLDALIELYARALEDATNPDSCAARDKIIGMGTKYGSTRNNACRYAAAHSIYSADAVPGPSEGILQRSRPRPQNLVMIGGEPEKTFWRVRETVRQGVTIQSGIAYLRECIKQLDCPIDGQGYQELLGRFTACSANSNGEYLRAQLISQAGQMPVYGMYKGDWSLRDVAERSFGDLMAAPFDLRMKRDLLAVLCDIADVPFERAYAVTNKKPLDPETYARLTAAYSDYADFCRDFLANTAS